MYPFDVILFDVGGVLLTNGWDHAERAQVLQRFHLDVAEFEARHVKPYAAWEIGAISVESYLAESVFYEPRSFHSDEFFAAICAQSKVLSDGALGILEELAAADKCLLGALNNEARETNEYRFANFGLNRQFKVSLSSCYLGFRKPDAEIYKRALDILGRPPERILFVDDRAGNVAAAQAQGIKSIQFEGAEALRKELVGLEVL